MTRAEFQLWKFATAGHNGQSRSRTLNVGAVLLWIHLAFIGGVLLPCGLLRQDCGSAHF
jgi:hypothetical protein